MKQRNSLRSLSKLELLELLEEQEQEIQALKQQLKEKDRIIAQRTLCMEQAGDIAQAALALNGVFEAAQKAANQYVESVKEMADRNVRQEKPQPGAFDPLIAEPAPTSSVSSLEQDPVMEEDAPMDSVEKLLRDLDLMGFLQEDGV